jgi:hypothetical protein
MSTGIKSTQGQPTGELMVNGQTVIIFSEQSLTIPRGITTDRPSSPQEGMIRFNTETKKFEGYAGTSAGWVNLH